MGNTKEYVRAYQERNKEKIALYKKNYHLTYKNRYNERTSEREETDLNFKLRRRLRTRLLAAVQNNQKTGSAVKDLGCSIEYFREYLESKFTEGMSWDNYGKTGWHMDHIKPLSSFDLTNPEEFKVACHYTNIQPLWAKDNYSKGCKVE